MCIAVCRTNGGSFIVVFGTCNKIFTFILPLKTKITIFDMPVVFLLFLYVSKMYLLIKPVVFK